MLDPTMQRYLIGEEKISEYSSMTLSTCGGPGCGCNLSLTLRANHKEEKFPGLRDDLPSLLEGIKEITLGGTASGILYNF
jgi:hypothetical protein